MKCHIKIWFNKTSVCFYRMVDLVMADTNTIRNQNVPKMYLDTWTHLQVAEFHCIHKQMLLNLFSKLILVCIFVFNSISTV